MKSKILFLILIAFCVYNVKAFGWMETVSERASNPITNLTQLQFENDFTPKNFGTGETSNEITLKPLIAFNRTERFPFEQLMRVKVQIPTLPNSPKTTRGTFLGDTQFFHLFIKEEPSWGRWGFGPAMIFPTATVKEAGQGKWQIGPAFGISVLKFSGWQFGFLAQNPISIGGTGHRPQQNYLLFQPFIIYHFLKNTYLITNGEWTIDWLHNAKQIPVNIGIGYTSSPFAGKLRLDTCLQFEYMAYKNAVKASGYINQYTIQLTFSLLFVE